MPRPRDKVNRGAERKDRADARPVSSHISDPRQTLSIDERVRIAVAEMRLREAEAQVADPSPEELEVLAEMDDDDVVPVSPLQIEPMRDDPGPTTPDEWKALLADLEPDQIAPLREALAASSGDAAPSDDTGAGRSPAKTDGG